MSLRELAEKTTQKAIQDLEARITNIWKACGTENALSPKYLIAVRKVEKLKAEIDELKGGCVKSDFLDAAERFAQLGFKTKKNQIASGKASAQSRKQKASERNAKILEKAKTLAAGSEKHEIAAKVARSFSVTATHVRNILHTAGFY